jgi:tRNA(Ile)-lysidine synthase
LAERAIVEYELCGRGERVLCACSGGADSTALLHVLALLQKRTGHRLEAMGVHHGLRPAAGGELALAGKLARSLAVPWHEVRLELEPGSNLQARARQARHTALQEVARAIGANRIAIGHTADDRAETLLIRLLRGAGPRGLAVLGPRSPCPIAADGQGPGVELVRPLVLGRHRDALAHLERHGLPHAEDPSNADRRFVRARVRYELLPLLEELSPRIVEHLCALASMLEATTSGPDPWAGLGRAQRLAIEHAIRQGRRRLTLRLQAGRDVEIDLAGANMAERPRPARSLRGTR